MVVCFIKAWWFHWQQLEKPGGKERQKQLFERIRGCHGSQDLRDQDLREKTSVLWCEGCSTSCFSPGVLSQSRTRGRGWAVKQKYRQAHRAGEQIGVCACRGGQGLKGQDPRGKVGPENLVYTLRESAPWGFSWFLSWVGPEAMKMNRKQIKSRVKFCCCCHCLFLFVVSSFMGLKR